MRVIIIMLFFLTMLLFFLAIFRPFIISKTQVIKKRRKRYFTNKAGQDEQVKKVRFQFNLDYTKKNIRKKLLTKTKNNKLETLLYRAGVPLKPEEYVIFQWIAVALGGGILYLIFDHIIAFPIGGIMGYMLPRVIIKKKQRNRFKAFNNNLPEMISSVVGALKAGFSFTQALKSVAEESEAPMKEELETVLREIQYGTTTEEALNHLYERMPSEDLDLMIQAIIIQRQVGGNLNTVLEKIVKTIRDRIQIQGQISTLTAQGRLSGMVIGLLPVAIGFFIYLIQPEYIGSFFTHPLGIILLIGAVISCAIGYFLIQKITTIEV